MSQPRHARVSRMTLSDEKVRALSPHGKLLWFALLTHKHGSMVPGFVSVSVAALAEDTDLSPKRVQREIDRMREAEMLRYDEAARLFWMPKAIHYNEPENPNVVKGWAKQWANLPDSGLLRPAAEVLMKVVCERQADSKNPENWTPSVNAFADASGTPSVNAFADASGTHRKPFLNPPPSPSPSPSSTPNPAERGSGHPSGSGERKPGRRAEGTNPRAQGSNPRARGDSPRGPSETAWRTVLEDAARVGKRAPPELFARYSFETMAAVRAVGWRVLCDMTPSQRREVKPKFIAAFDAARGAA